MDGLRVGDFVLVPYGGLAQIIKEHPTGDFAVRGITCASETYHPEALILYVPQAIEERFQKLEEEIEILRHKVELG